MAKRLQSASKAKRAVTKRDTKSGRFVDYDVAGKTSDGVTVLRAKARPTSFTSREIRETIIKLRNGSLARG